MKDKAGVEYGLNLQPGQTGSWQTVMPFAWSNGAELTNEDGTEYTIDSPEMAEALDYYTSLLRRGPLASAGCSTPASSRAASPRARRLLHLRPVAHRPGRGRRASSDDQYAVAPLPGPDGARHVVRRRRRPRRVQGLRQPRQRLEVRPVADASPRPSRRSTTRSATCRPSRPPGTPASSPTDPQLQVFGEQLEDDQAPPAVPTWEQVAAAIDSTSSRPSKGDLSVEDAVAADADPRPSSIGTGL